MGVYVCVGGWLVGRLPDGSCFNAPYACMRKGERAGGQTRVERVYENNPVKLTVLKVTREQGAGH